MSGHDEIRAAGAILGAALDKYLDMNLAMRNNYLEQKPCATTPLNPSSYVESERQFVAALQLKLEKAKTVINQVQNYSTCLVPIHKLPQELLARIFLIAFESRPKSDYRSRPETVSRVCVRWRDLALSLPSLWRRINLPFNRVIYKSLVTRGKVFASRAHPRSLDVSLYAPVHHPEPMRGESLKALIHEIAPQIGSLDLDTTWKECNLVLSPFLPKCKPGTLKTLTTCHDSSSGLLFAAPRPLPDYCRRYSPIEIGDSDVEIRDFDRVLASLTTLRLTGFYPFWTSQAYHRLTELRLVRGQLSPENAVISEDHLIGILRASPAIRILEFSLTVVQVLPTKSSVCPISLEHLESLNVAEIKLKELGTLLRWIAPGPKPLQLAIDLDLGDNSDTSWLESLDNAVASFFARSRVSRLHAKYGDYEGILGILDLCPRLETLACLGTRCSRMHVPAQDITPISHSTLKSLLILSISVDTAPLLNIISGSPSLKSILFWKCDSYDGKSYNPLCVDSLKAMVGLGPKIAIIDCDPSRDWELFAP